MYYTLAKKVYELPPDVYDRDDQYNSPYSLIYPEVKYDGTSPNGIASVVQAEKKKHFVNKLTKAIRDIDTSDLSNIDFLEHSVQVLAHTIDRICGKNSKIINITKHSKSWWDGYYNRNLEKYRTTKCIEDQKQFKKTVKSTKQAFFDQKIQEIANKRCGLQKLMNYVNKHKLPAIEAIKYNGYLYFKIKDI